MKCQKCGRKMKDQQVFRLGEKFVVAQKCSNKFCRGGEVLLSREYETFVEAMEFHLTSSLTSGRKWFLEE